MTTQPVPATTPTEAPAATARKLPRVVRFMARILLLAWGAFWGWFITMNILSDGPSAFQFALPLLVGVVLAALVPWKWVRLGGLLAIAVGAFACWAFTNADAFALAAFAGVPVVTGLLLLIVGPTRA